MKAVRAAHGLAFALGIVCLAIMSIVAAWPDMEASVFDPDTAQAGEPAPGMLGCPLVLAADETGTVTARFGNRSAVTDSFRVRGRISRGFVTFWRQHSEQVTVPPHQARTVQWTVSPPDAAYRRLILVRVMALPSARSPARQASCGILVVPIAGAGGRWLFAGGVALGLLGLASGALGWLGLRRSGRAAAPEGGRWPPWRGLRREEVAIRRRAAFLALVVLASLGASLSGWWLAGLLLLFAALLALVTLLEHPRSGSG